MPRLEYFSIQNALTVKHVKTGMFCAVSFRRLMWIYPYLFGPEDDGKETP